MRNASARVALFLLAAASPLAAGATEYHASNFFELTTAINLANADPGSTILLAPGTYSGGALPNITADLTVALDPASGATPGAAIIATIPTGDKGLFTVPSGLSDIDLSVNGLTFQNAAISGDENGAGIRFQSAGDASLVVMNSMFVGNQNGILTGFGAALVDELLDVTISNSLFANNGSGSGFTHAVYVQGRSLNVTGSTFCGTNIGHDIKARTATTMVSGSGFYDGIAGPDAICNIGSASYSIDMPNGGQGTITDNQFFQGAAGDNPAIISFGEEGVAYANNSLIVDGNSFNSTINGTAIQEAGCITPVQLGNNTFTSNLTPVVPIGCSTDLEPGGGGPGGGDPGTTPVDEPGTAFLVMGAAAAWSAWRLRRRRALIAAA
jgi:hypothetical protein